MTKDEALRVAMDWYGSGNQDPDEFEKLIKTIAAQRTWVGLMDNEAIELALKVISRLDLPPATKVQLEQQFIRALHEPNSLWMLFAAEIEAKLKEKNHG